VSANRRKAHQSDDAARRSVREARRDAQRAERRDHLLDAAIAEIRTIGPGATMEQLATAGGVTKPILYRHFGDRDGLIHAIAERFSTGLLASVEGPLLSQRYPRELLESTIEGYVAFLERDPYLYGFLMQQASVRNGRHTPIGSLVDVVAKQIAVISREQLIAVGRDAGSAVPWAYGIVGLVHTATNWWLEDRTMTRERFVRYLTDLLWDGLAAAGDPERAGADAASGT
jgi:AcrR family transcriptional regulator